MPYKKISDLPENVRHVLPKRAQELFLKAFNSAWGQYKGDEIIAFKVAWTAVKKEYKKKGPKGKWIRK
ncbi:MAG: ChaB family protein [Candidatus ainarchaeum sp.]|nr:ChaB family protein [Candidatus ainarchaeum sp.]